MVSRWLWPRNRTLLEVDSMVVSWWILAFFAQWYSNDWSIHTIFTKIPKFWHSTIQFPVRHDVVVVTRAGNWKCSNKPIICIWHVLNSVSVTMICAVWYTLVKVRQTRQQYYVPQVRPDCSWGLNPSPPGHEQYNHRAIKDSLTWSKGRQPTNYMSSFIEFFMECENILEFI